MATPINTGRASEFDLIGRYFRPLATSDAARDLRDDAAVLSPPSGQSLAVTVDTVTEGVHFLPNTDPGDIARKALRVNVSDLAAMGAVPVGYTVALSLTPQVDEAWLTGFARGLQEDQEAFGMALLGGDTTSTPGPLSLTISAFGFVPTGQAVPRSGAKPGDALIVTGTIGDAALGLLIESGQGPDLPSSLSAELSDRYLRPQPRLGLLAHLGQAAHAAIDVSDGLIADAGHIAEESGVAITMQSRSVPMSQAAVAALEAEPNLLETILTGGDDYEVLAAIDPSSFTDALTWATSKGVRLTQIGAIETGNGVVVIDADGQPIQVTRSGYQHQ